MYMLAHSYAMSMGGGTRSWEETYIEKCYRSTQILPTVLWNGEDLVQVPLPCNGKNFHCTDGVVLVGKSETKISMALMQSYYTSASRGG